MLLGWIELFAHMDFKDILQTAITHHKAGELENAEQLYRSILSKQANHPDANHNLGVLLKQDNKADIALPFFKSALESNPNQGQYWISYIDTLIHLQRYEAAQNVLNQGQAKGLKGDAVDRLKERLTSKVKPSPEPIDTQTKLANTATLANTDLEPAIQLRESGDYQEGQVNKKNPSGPPQAQVEAVISLYSQGQIQEALRASETLIKDYPNTPLLYNISGACYKALGQLDAAVKRYEQALAIKPDFTEAHSNLGLTLHELGQLEEAVKRYEQALAIKPDYAETHYNLGNTLQELGQLEEAVKHYEQALAIKPDFAEAHQNLSKFKRYSAEDSQITQMESLLSTDELDQSYRMHLCFALAKAFEDIGQHNDLFRVLHEGNRLRKKDLNYSLDQDKNLHCIIRKLFHSQRSICKYSKSYEPPSVQPIFIVGMPRSGTTLVEQIIASHHAVHGAGELDYLNNIITPIINYNLNHQPSSLSKETHQSIRKQYLDSLTKLNVPEKIITDKMPLNFQYIGFILSAFPEAKIIHLKRDAIATCWSIYKHYFNSKGNGFSYNQNDLASFYHLYTDLMVFWHQQFPDKIYDLCYEELTTNQEEETRQLLSYCDLDWDKNCLNFHTNKRPARTASAIQVRQKMYQGSSEAWRKHEARLQPLINALKPVS